MFLMYMQDVVLTLNQFWASRGCILWQPYHTEVGAGTSNPATFLRVLGPEPWWVAYPEPCIRPTDGRYGENPNRLQHYCQYQVILKPSPSDVQDLFLQSLEALGLDLTKHDFRFVEDNWQSPSLGAWGLGWEAWLDGMEILQFTYFQECGGVKLDVRACELTYGIERIAMYLQGVDNVYDLKWAPSGITYGDIFHASEVEWCKYNFEAADTTKLFDVFDLWEKEGMRLLEEGLILPAYDHCLRLSHLFNLLDARGALSVSERGRFLLRCRVIAEGCAKGYFGQREEQGFPLCRLPRPGTVDDGAPIEIDAASFKDSDDFLLEIGVEELPHGDVKRVSTQAPALMEKLLDEQQLAHKGITVHVTPRRIAFLVDQLAARQEDVTKEARGPKKQAAQDGNGEWTIPATRFAQGNGATVDDIEFRKDGKFEYCYVKVEQKGKHLTELLSDIVAGLLRGIQFGKTMGWEDSTVTFSRPVRWMLALHGANAVPVSWQLRGDSDVGPARALHSGRVTYGHRRLAPGEITVVNPGEYLDKLREGLVLPQRDERMEALRTKAQAIADEQKLFLEDDDALFDEICDILEWPEPILCAIPEDALKLPEEITITPMKVYQRYIPLRTKDGALSKHFLAVANGQFSDEGRQIIGQGNEQVLHARLRDATYFWNTDTKTSLATFAEGLSSVMFHQKLGSVGDKIDRLQRLYGALKDTLPTVDDKEMEQVLRLMKADLTTQMVGEYDSLEGLVGMLYAQKEGLSDTVATALFEHRLPRRAGDKLPSSDLGIVAGLLDRIDTLAGYFGIGLKVKGTSDPFGLRRNTLALLGVVQSANLDFHLGDAIKASLDIFGDLTPKADAALSNFLGFAKDRMAVMTRDEGFAYDKVSAALASHATRPLPFRACLAALSQLSDEQVQEMAEQTKRMQRIVKEPAASIDESLLDENEKALFALCGEPCGKLSALVASQDFTAVFAELLTWAPAISAYFEEVLVNDKDDAIRQNRHALVKKVYDTIKLAADFTEIEKK